MMRSRDAEPEVVFFDHGEWADGHCHFDRLGIMLWASAARWRATSAMSMRPIPCGSHGRSRRWPTTPSWWIGQSQAKPGKARRCSSASTTRSRPWRPRRRPPIRARPREYRRTIVQIPTESGAPVRRRYLPRPRREHSRLVVSRRGRVAGPVGGDADERGEPGRRDSLCSAQRHPQRHRGRRLDGRLALGRWRRPSPLDVRFAGNSGQHWHRRPGQRRRDEEGKRLPYLVVRRTGGTPLTSTFVCIHEPFSGAPGIRSVRLLEADAGRAEWPVALTVEAAGKSWRLTSSLSEGEGRLTVRPE